MKYFLVGIAVFILLFLSISPVSATHELSEPSDGTVNSFIPVSPPKAITPLTFNDADQQKKQLSSFKGKVVIVNLWASWCPPCIRELPALNRLQKTFGGKHFVVVAIAIDRTNRQAARNMHARLKLDHLTYFEASPDSIEKILPVDVLPSSFIINREGQLTQYLRSYVDWDSSEALGFVSNLIKESSKTN